MPSGVAGGPAPALGDAPLSEIRSRALKLLTNREHSRRELARKLLRRGYPGADVERVLDQLVDEDLLSEARLVAAYVAERLDKGFGPVRIRFELREKGLSEALIEPHLAIDDAELLQRITLAHNKRFGDTAMDDPRERARRARFLEYRGFPPQLVARFLSGD
jgi:regulatory protein